MIISFRHKGLELFYKTGSAKGGRADHAKKLKVILVMLDAAEKPEDINQPGLHLHSLKGYWSVRVNGNWRITFRFVGSDVELLNYQDYH